METLATISDVRRCRPSLEIASDETDLLDSFLMEAQLLDVRPWLGDALLLELVNQRRSGTLTPDNELLLEGGVYTYNGNSCYLVGLITCICYYAMARSDNQGTARFTQFGMVQKESDFSQPLTDKRISEIRASNIDSAEAFKQDCIAMLRRRADKYPLFACNSPRLKRRTNIRAIGK